MNTEDQEASVEWETADETSVPDFSTQLKEFGETLINSFNDRVDALSKKYDDLRHTMTMQIDTRTTEEPDDWSWENLRETMFPHTVG